jgi:hypothetical protein
VRVNRLADLVDEPEPDPWQPHRTQGLSDVADLLAAARHLPHRLVLNASVAEEDLDGPTVACVTDGVHRLAEARAASAWREAMEVRHEGTRQMPVSLTIAVVAAALAGGLAYLAGNAASTGMGVLLAIAAGLSMTIAWVTSWMVMEYALYDWRAAARRARVYDLLAHAELVVTPRAESASDRAAAGSRAGSGTAPQPR